MKVKLIIVIAGFLKLVFPDALQAQVETIRIFPDSIINDVSRQPVGINLNFLMDGGRFPQPKHTVKDALRKMGVKYLRYPGGEKSDLYLFSVPPYNRSQPALARTAGLGDYPGILNNDKTFTWDPLDFDEFIAICRQVNAEPVVVVAADNYLIKPGPGETVSTRSALIEHATAWVNYANIDKKYGIKYWMIGNESWNSNNPNSTPDIYAQDVIDFSKAMKAVDPSILIVPNGDSEDFFKTVITKAGDHIDRICVSNYGVYNFTRGYNTYRDTAQVLIWPALTAVNALNKYATKEQREKLKVIVAEFGSIDWAHFWKGTNDIGHAIVTFDMAGQLLLQPQIEFSCFWNTRWLDSESKPGTDHDALDKDGNLNPTGMALMIWNRFTGRKMIKAESAGPVISYSSRDNDRLFVFLINKSENIQDRQITLENYKPGKVVQSWEYAGKTDSDMKPVWKKKKITEKDKLQLSRFSITIIEYRIQKNKSKD